jgi:hypothetical protein
MELATHRELAAAHVRHEENRVNKSILKLWSSPNTTLILLGVFVCLSVAVLAEGRPEV